MGWFSKSSTSSPVEQDDASPATAAAPSAAPQTDSNPAPSAPVAEEPVVAQQTAPVPTTVVSPQAIMEFDEYKEPDDIFARFQVSHAMNELAACSSLGSNIRNYYRYGTFKDCAARYDHLKFCLSIKTKSSQVAQVMIQKRDADLRAHKKSQPNSEDVWSLRS
ncbi:hypothetical protein BGZ95_006930 [Linnemannia exigua]|uniref:Early meiotic induction protein 1 n=1 Tax=Linnemannia exigua TaxID=604196 RepID=A0AAD4DL71_9FUNG|nr:hypothetical protein BGZ95_006930 [Linnemannia exigua]